eukprot:GILI01025597.1.p1 GENE.GILI01025597.1~~GILI01025597.1.p1  ORF type:complete len:155 (+),score=8.04 GILI01025597.1:77-541(+)
MPLYNMVRLVNNFLCIRDNIFARSRYCCPSTEAAGKPPRDILVDPFQHSAIRSARFEAAKHDCQRRCYQRQREEARAEVILNELVAARRQTLFTQRLSKLDPSPGVSWKYRSARPMMGQPYGGPYVAEAPSQMVLNLDKFALIRAFILWCASSS